MLSTSVHVGGIYPRLVEDRSGERSRLPSGDKSASRVACSIHQQRPQSRYLVHPCPQRCHLWSTNRKDPPPLLGKGIPNTFAGLFRKKSLASSSLKEPQHCQRPADWQQWPVTEAVIVRVGPGESIRRGSGPSVVHRYASLSNSILDPYETIWWTPPQSYFLLVQQPSCSYLSKRIPSTKL